MALAQKKTYISPEQYLEIRRTSDVLSEYLDGEVLAMAGNSKAHGIIVASVTRTVGNLLVDKACDTSAGISIKAPTSYLIPDLVVYCGDGEFTEVDDLLLNPLIVFEVLSDSTERYDRGHKWMKYQQIDSLRHYVMISQGEPFVEVYTRRPDGGWNYDSSTGNTGHVSLSHLDLTLALADIYGRVEFVD